MLVHACFYYMADIFVGGNFGMHSKKPQVTSLVKEEIRQLSCAIWMTCLVEEAAHNISCAHAH